MEYRPHEYQKYAIDYILSHRISAVLLDMGLGKTSITLTAIQDLLFDSFDAHKVLVIGPLRVARDTWPAEVDKWDHLKDLRVSVVIGTEAQRKAALRTQADIYIINRENVQWLVEKSGVPFDFDTVVIDELSSFKNYNSKRFKALMQVRPKVRRIVGLTGTPSGNGLMDLFGEFKILDGGKRLGRYITQYRDMFFTPDYGNGPIVYSYSPKPWAEDEIYKRISDITISMRAGDYLEMPERIDSEYTIYLSDDEKAQYDSFVENFYLELEEAAKEGIVDSKDFSERLSEVTAANAAVLTGQLMQIANGAIYDDEKEAKEIHQRKLDALEDIVEAAAGKPILVAYWFKHDLERIKERLDKLGVKYAQINSSKSIKDWNDKKLTVGLIHPASAGHGLNLQEGSNTIVWFGLTFSLELYQQTNARLLRQGQKEKTVVIQHIVAKNTVDEKVIKALQGKCKMQDALIDAVKAEIGGIHDKNS